MRKEFFQGRQLQPSSDGFLDDCAGDWVFAALLGGGRCLENHVDLNSLKPDDFAQFQSALRQGAGLIESKGTHFGETLKRRAPLEEHAGFR
jgi:hypothetical protein